MTTTGYKILIGTADLSTIFAPYVSGAQTNPTGYKVANGDDLSTIFAPYISGRKANPTGYKLANGDDLSDAFLPNSPAFPAVQPSLPSFGDFLCVDLDGSNMVMCSTKGGRPLGNTYTYLYWSNDSGETLNIARINGDIVKFFGCAAISGANAVAMGRIEGGTNNYYVSNDYGQTYVTATGGAGSAQAADGVTIDISGAIALWTNNGLSLYRSNDYGNTWTNIGNSGSGGFIKIYGSDVYVCRGAGLFYSTDSGLTYTKSTSSVGFVYGVVRCGSNLYVSSGTGMYKSTNNGMTLTSVTNPGGLSGLGGCAGRGTNGDFLWVGGGGGVNYYSNNGGVTWTTVSGVVSAYMTVATTTNIVSVSSDNGTFYYGRNAYIT
jgi:hypothetical protein